MVPRGGTDASREHETPEETDDCRRCGRTVSEDARRCPECGYRPRLEGATIGAGILLVGLVISVLVSPLLGAPALVLGLGVLCLSPFMTVTNSEMMPATIAPTGERPPR